MKPLQYRFTFPVFLGLALGLTVFPTATLSSTPGYDCAKATGQVQQIVCSDDALAALDRQLTDVYALALSNFPPDELATLRAEQRGWIKGRDDCWKSAEFSSCVRQQYQARIVELQIKSGQLQAPTAVGYDCATEDDSPVLAAFYSDTNPASVVLTMGDGQVIAFIAASASGARYTTSGVEFWEHQSAATLSWFGTQFTCKLLEKQ